MVSYSTLREYRMFIGARDIGTHLEVSWFLTLNPGFLKRTISKNVAFGNPLALSQNISVFAQQDLAAFVSIASDCVYETVKLLMEELQQDTTGDRAYAKKMRVLSAPGMVLLVFAITFAAIDWYMSIEP